MRAEDVRTLAVERKIQIMEVIWEDFRERFERSDTSPEQKQLLDRRRARVRRGVTRLLDWDAVKRTLETVALVCVTSMGVVCGHGASPRVWKPTTAPSECWFGIASSADGDRLVAVGEGGIYLSRDSGLTWKMSPAPLTNRASIACSADGAKLVAAVGSPFGVRGPVYTSSDSGATWKRSDAPSTGGRWPCRPTGQES